MPQFRSYVSPFWQWKLHNHCMSLLSIVFCSHRLSFTLSIRYSFWMLPCFFLFFMFFPPTLFPFTVAHPFSSIKTNQPFLPDLQCIINAKCTGMGTVPQTPYFKLMYLALIILISFVWLLLGNSLTVTDVYFLIKAGIPTRSRDT